MDGYQMDGPVPGRTEVLDQLKKLWNVVSEHEIGPGDGGLVAELARHFGSPPHQMAVLTEDFANHRYVDGDIALAELAARDPEHRAIGVGGGEARYHHNLSDMIQPLGVGFGGGRWPLAQVDYANIATGPDSERACLAYGIRLFEYAGTPVAVLLRKANPSRGRSSATMEVLCPEQSVAARLLDELRELSLQRSVLRGQVISFAGSGYEQSEEGVTFVPRPTLPADQVILPDGVLSRVLDHVVGIADHAEVLARHGQHLKRGVLLYGPPGSGKTHTVRHLLSVTQRHTVVLLAGETLRFVGLAAKLARAMQPAIVVLEDCDLIAEDRDMSYGAKPLLFEVLDAMDGLDADADVTFLLTTNRVEAMERALSQRPGRVDLAVEVPLPDDGGRLALLRLYAPPGAFSDEVLAQTAARIQGTTASFSKELIRRSVLAAATAGQEPGDGHLRTATEVILADGDRLSRALLGVASPEAESDGAGHQGPDPGIFQLL
ncbi:AAA family ATPase [Nostocoides sp.]|uniref:AAA family ATPase n=1 Tax=Nostocoides sp. TaxID=1917966 RepID=UPI002B771F1D|nr:ATP-binding protein [Tetrasphaera sp.]